jgi:TonB family protein
MAARILGKVVVSILVDPKGDVACVQGGSGHPLIVSRSMDAARKWKFKPMTENGRPVGFYGLLEFHIDTANEKVDSCAEAH